MTDLNTAMVERYRNDFLKEVEANVEMGDWVKMCMQCGVCSGSCPLGPFWEHPPQELFMMIRAGKRDEVLQSESMWMCELRPPPRARAQDESDAPLLRDLLAQHRQERAGE